MCGVHGGGGGGVSVCYMYIPDKYVGFRPIRRPNSKPIYWQKRKGTRKNGTEQEKVGKILEKVIIS